MKKFAAVVGDRPWSVAMTASRGAGSSSSGGSTGSSW